VVEYWTHNGHGCVFSAQFVHCKRLGNLQFAQAMWVP